ncbi:uncharacterized protein [Ptychodera flava]|uniref:uncharacterized protein n=1 Tax=Ptychodera flava TaxID=63121 RepID=UPI003969F357
MVKMAKLASLLVLVLLALEARFCQSSTSTVPLPVGTTDDDVTDDPTTAAPTVATTSGPDDTTTAPVPPVTTRPRTTTELPNPSPIPELVEEGGVEAELGTSYAGWNSAEYRNALAKYANDWCINPYENCYPSEPLIISARDVVVYDEGSCTDMEYQCTDDSNMVAACYITKPSQSHELLMSSESLTNMLIKHASDLEQELGYTVQVPQPEEEDDTYSLALEPWVIALICFCILCLIVVLIIVWVWYRRKKRLEKMPKDDFSELMTGNGYGHATMGKKDEGTLVYQAWITKAMTQDEASTQVRKGDIAQEMSELESGNTQRSDVIVARVNHENETKEPESVTVTTASVEPTPTSPTDVQAEMPKDPPHYEEITETSGDVQAEMPKDPPHYEEIKDTSELPPPPPETQAAEAPAETDEPLPAPPSPVEAETEVLNELDKLIVDEEKSPEGGVDNPTFDSNIVDEETGTSLEGGAMTTAL